MDQISFQVSLYLIRHAQSEINLNYSIICGQSNSAPLTDLGFQQSILLGCVFEQILVLFYSTLSSCFLIGKRLKYENIQFDHLLSSSAIRTRQTAQTVLDQLHIDSSRLIFTEAFLEQSQGDWEGSNRRDTYNEQVLREMSEKILDFTPPNGESMRIVQKRCIDYLQTFLDQAKQQSIEQKRIIRIAVFTHGNTIRGLLQYFLQTEPKYSWLPEIHNTSITQITFNQHGIVLSKTNDDAHLILTIPDS